MSEAGKSIVVRLLHSMNIVFGMAVSVLGRFTVVNDEHCLKMPKPKVVTDAGIVTLTKPVWMNAKSPIALTESGIVTSCNLLQP